MKSYNGPDFLNNCTDCIKTCYIEYTTQSDLQIDKTEVRNFIDVMNNMADSHTLASSSNMSNSDYNVSCNDPLKPNNEFIYRIRDDFYWKGDLDDLKELVKSSINIEGKWTSPGGDYKLFYNEEFSLNSPVA